MGQDAAAEAAERKRALLGTAAFAAGPLAMAGLVPWVLTRWKASRPVPGGAAAQVAGGAMVVAGAAALTGSFVRFAAEGLGTPAPFAPPRRLVVGGLYRFVRNPMYLAAASAVAGQGLLLGQRKLLWATAIWAVPVELFVRLYEEPDLARRFGDDYARYRRHVPRWVPRATPWTPPASSQPPS